MKKVLDGNDFFINPRKVRNLIEIYAINKCKLPVNLESENYVSIQFIYFMITCLKKYMFKYEYKVNVKTTDLFVYADNFYYVKLKEIRG